ncbi:VRR-NUC domain-containing protein [Marinobacter sp. C2H3]|uniref:VRR-NUC domain-containing protein n=1 Tax=Marinobacter sp. C2H3 TaxID=3119003 RepID=UPI00300EAD97
MVSPRPTAPLPAAANLDDPLYYLRNLETVVGWVLDHHSDLLVPAERRRLSACLALPTAARALLTRLIMRTGELFRADKLRYPELGVPEAEALATLVAEGWLDDEPILAAPELFRLCTLGELRPAFAGWLAEQGLTPTLAKGPLLEAVSAGFADPRPLSQWLDRPEIRVVRLAHMALFDRVRLMFFGNLRQSWSDFVLVELGHQRYETVPLTPDGRAFQHRSEVDLYLAMHECREQLDQGLPAADVWRQVPPATDNPWLTRRRDRLLLELGRQVERQGDRPLALAALTESGHREAGLKRLRLLERMRRHAEAWDLARRWYARDDLTDAEAQGLARILKRLAARQGEPAPALAEPPAIQAFELDLPNPAPQSVEWAVAQHLWRDDAPVHYVENTLFTALFGLLCWPAIYAPVPGAFFHPFHVGPADLNDEGFVGRRRDRFEDCLAALDDGTYEDRIRAIYAAKQGVSNPFVVWPVITPDRLDLALHCLPADHLKPLFRRLMANVREHRSGFPDLIRFFPDRPSDEIRYELIEVKGPGDRLQDHQVRWLEFFARQGMPARVCYVRWQGEAPAP